MSLEGGCKLEGAYGRILATIRLARIHKRKRCGNVFKKVNDYETNWTVDFMFSNNNLSRWTRF